MIINERMQQLGGIRLDELSKSQQDHSTIIRGILTAVHGNINHKDRTKLFFSHKNQKGQPMIEDDVGEWEYRDMEKGKALKVVKFGKFKSGGDAEAFGKAAGKKLKKELKL